MMNTNEFVDEYGRVLRWGQADWMSDHCTHMLTFGQYRLTIAHSMVDVMHNKRICLDINQRLLREMDALIEQEANECLTD